MFSGILGNLFKAREKVARDIERKRRESSDYDPDEDYDDEEKPFLDHLEDLRKVIMRVAATLLAGLIICFCIYKPLLVVIFQPIETAGLARIIWVEKDANQNGGFRLVPFEDEKAADAEEDQSTAPQSEGVDALPAGDPILDAIVELRHRLDVLEGIATETGVLTAAAPVEEPGLRIVALGVPEAFMSTLKVCFLGAITLTFPLNLYFILSFVLPGLKRKEKKMLWPALAVGTFLFLIGLSFSYWVALPRVLDFFYGFGQDIGVQSDFRLVEYIKFSTRLILLFGLCFELPVVVMALVKLDVLNYTMMNRTRGYAVVIIFVVAAIITPTPDAATLILLGLPMVVLYEVCIWLAYFLEKRDRQLNPDYYADLDEAERRETSGVPGSVPFSIEDKGSDEHGHDWHEDPHHPWHDDEHADTLDNEDDGGTPGEPEGERDRGSDEFGSPEAHSSPGYTRAKLMRMKKSELQAILESMGLGDNGTKEYLTDMILDHQDLW